MARPTADLAREATLGVQSAWDALVGIFADAVWAVARAHGLRADDAAQVSRLVWLRLADELESIQEVDRLGVWLVRSARRESLRALALVGRPAPQHDDTLPALEWVATLSEPNTLPAGGREVSAAFRKLPILGQVIVRLVATQSVLTLSDIGEALGVPAEAIGRAEPGCLALHRRLAAQTPNKQSKPVGGNGRRALQFVERRAVAI